MAILARTVQYGWKIEAAEGTRETLAAADFAARTKIGSEESYEAGNYERELAKASLSKDPSVRGSRRATIPFTVELVGGGASTPCKWHEALRAAGFAVAATPRVVTVGSVSGGAGASFEPGQSIGDNATQGSATKTGKVIAFVPVSPNKLIYLPGTGTFADTDTMYNYGVSPQASAAVDSAPAAAGYRFTPLSETNASAPPSLSVEKRIGGEAHVLVGARCNGTLAMRADEAAMLELEAMGSVLIDNATGRPPTASAMTGITYEGVQPLAVKGMRVRVGTYAPILTQVTMDLGNTMSPEATINDNDYVSSGLRGARITDRAITVALDPDYDVSGGLDVIARTMLGGTFPLSFMHPGPASATHGNGMIVVIAPQAQLEATHSPGDRDGKKTSPITARLCGTADDEVEIFHVFA